MNRRCDSPADIGRALVKGGPALLVMIFVLLGVIYQRSLADTFQRLPAVDTYVVSGQPQLNFAGQRLLRVGHDLTRGYQQERSLIGFSTSAIPPGSRVSSATLRLHLAGTTTGDAPITVSAHRVRSDWGETITWQEHLGLNVDSVASASVSVPASLGEYVWDVTAALQVWSNVRDTSNFSLLLRSDVTSGQHERNFWSGDCSPTDCGPAPGSRPRLDIVFDPPTPTRTVTPSRTVTMTPTTVPGMRATLRSNPSGAVEHDAEITYYIDYAVVGGATLGNVYITNEIPNGTMLVAGSISSPGREVGGGVLRWDLGSLGPDTAGTASYRVRVSPHTATPTSTPSPSRTSTPTITLTPGTGCGTIDGYMYVDADGDGHRDVNETVRVVGAHIRLKLGGVQVATRQTIVEGYYAFANLDPGQYTVEAVLTEGYDNTSALSLSASVQSCVAAPRDFGVRSCIAVQTAANPVEAGTTNTSGGMACPGGGPKFKPNTTLTFNAPPNAGYTFRSWTITGATPTSSSQASTVVTLGTSDPVVATAQYDACVNVSAQASPTGAGAPALGPATCTGGSKYAPGQAVSLNANPNSGISFTNWSLSGAGSVANPNSADTSFAPGNSDAMLTANFIAWTPTVTSTPTRTPTVTLTPTVTRTPTATRTPTSTPLCVAVSTAVAPAGVGNASIVTQPPQCGTKYWDGVAIEIDAAVTNSSYKWDGWTRDTAGSFQHANQAHTWFTPNGSDAVITANFVLKPLAASREEPMSPARPLNLVRIENRGAYIYWTYAGTQYSLRTNTLPADNRVYLPLIVR